jgi:hypothetical protein
MSKEIILDSVNAESLERKADTAIIERSAADPKTEAVTTINLFPNEGKQALRSRLEALKVGFVDDPQRSAEQAESLVSEAIDELIKQLSSRREKLTKDWREDRQISTEDFRLAFQGYRALFERVLSL